MMNISAPRLRTRAVVAATFGSFFWFTSTVRPAAQTASVQWTNLVNAAPAGTGVQKTGGCGTCPDAGATSAEAIGTGDGYAEFVPGLGARLFAGLGSNATASTDPALIDFAFSFWADGGWDIRERNVYKSEGRFVGGDVFRVALVGDVVKYYQNGTLVYSSTAAATLPLVLDTALIGAGATLTSATITAEAVAPPAPPTAGPPSTYDAITDRVVRPKGPVPALGAAGYAFTDPDFGSRIVRITDRETRPAALDRSYRTPSGVHSNAWSADGRHFYSTSTDGTILLYAFDPANKTATRLQPSTVDDGGLTVRFFNEPTFSYLTPGVMYGTYSGPGGNLRSVDQFDLVTGQYTQLLDLDTLAPNMADTYAGSVMASAGPVEKIITFFGGSSQDRHFYLLVLEKNDPANRRFLNTLTSTVDGQITDVPLNFSIHSAAIDRSGRYVMVNPTAADQAPPRSAAPVYVWDTVTNTFTATPLASAMAGGHDAYGYGDRINQDCCTSTTWDAAQWQLRSLATPLDTSDLIKPVLLPKEVFLADHPSWHNAQPDRLVPFIDANYRYGTTTVAWRAWDEEIIAVQTAEPGTGGTVWRFAHHRSNVANDADPTRISFWYTPRVHVSPNGRWALFTSNWEKTLGTDPHGEVGGVYRQDLFVVELQATAQPVAPVSVVTTALADGTALLPIRQRCRRQVARGCTCGPSSAYSRPASFSMPRPARLSAPRWRWPPRR